MKYKYLALLRGINVSGKNPLKMKEFQALLESNGFEKVITYIQSGNILFKSDSIDNKEVADKISKLIKVNYDYDVPVIVLKKAELEDLIKKNPFVEEATDQPTKVLVSFFSDSPNTELLQIFKSVNFENEEYKFDRMHVYLFCKNGYGKAKINNNFLEKKLKLKATTRNWKTILKLFELF